MMCTNCELERDFAPAEPAERPGMAEPMRRRRDVRVDRIGFVQELVKHWIEARPGGVKAKVKADLEPGEGVEGDFFEASLIPTTDAQVSVSAVLKLYEERSISRSELVEMLTAQPNFRSNGLYIFF
jgi:hypothetical protein